MITAKRGTSQVMANKAKYKYFRELNLRVLGFSDADYFTMIFDAGVEFILFESCETEDFISEILTTEGFFWPWFVNQWNIADEDFVFKYELEKIEGYVAKATREAIIEHYLKFHQTRLYSRDTEKGYMLTISNLIKAKTHGSNRIATKTY